MTNQPAVAFFNEEDLLDLISDKDAENILKILEENKNRAKNGEKNITLEEFKRKWGISE